MRLNYTFATALGAALFLSLSGCTGGARPTVDAGTADGGPANCGPTTCTDGLVCCNASCGICAEPGEGCIAIACVDSGAPDGGSCGGLTCGAGEVCCTGCGPGELYCSGAAGGGDACPPISCPPPGSCGGTVCDTSGPCCLGCCGAEICAGPDGTCPDVDCSTVDCPPPPTCGDAICDVGSVCCIAPDGSQSCMPGPACPGAPPGFCGPRTGASCERAEYCAFPIGGPGSACGAEDGTGVCAARPSACSREYAPVCGCDGLDYTNACIANLNGTDIASVGVCPSTPSDCRTTGCAMGESCVVCGPPGTGFSCVPDGTVCAL